MKIIFICYKKNSFLIYIFMKFTKTNPSMFRSYCWEYLVIFKYKFISYFKLSSLIKNTFKRITMNKLNSEKNLFK